MKTNRERIQMVGTEMDLSEGSPLNMIADRFAGGTEQMIGSEVNLSQRTDPMGSFEGAYAKHVRGGRVDMIGQEEPTMVTRTPRRGWDSYETPISTNSEGAEARTSSYPSMRGK